MHAVELEERFAAEPGVAYPRCAAGARACPPEDVGGAWRYAEFLEALADPDSEDHDELLEWEGDDFDPEAFDLARVNKRLSRLQ